MSLGENLKTARVRKELTLVELSRLCRDKPKPNTICGYEKGEKIPSVPILAKMAAVLGVTMDELIRGEASGS